MKRFSIILLALSTLLFGANVFARGWGHHYGQHGRYSHLGIVIGAPLIWPPYPYYYSYPHTQVVVERQPQIYVQREVPAVQAAPSNYWYFCPDTRSYYPYAQSCPSGWLQVVPQTAPVSPQP